MYKKRENIFFLKNKIPLSITDGDYRLKLEGYEAARPDRIHFVKQSMLTFHSEFLAIVVQTNRKVYCNSMSGMNNLKIKEIVYTNEGPLFAFFTCFQ